VILFLVVSGYFTRHPRDNAVFDQQDVQCSRLSAVNSMDPVKAVKGMYRLLDLISESGSNGYGKGRLPDADMLR
jgi:hypothetical protein